MGSDKTNEHHRSPSLLTDGHCALCKNIETMHVKKKKKQFRIDTCQDLYIFFSSSHNKHTDGKSNFSLYMQDLNDRDGWLTFQDFKC